MEGDFSIYHNSLFYRKDALGVVHFKGEIKCSGSCEGETAFILPEGYRPGYRVEVWLPSGGSDQIGMVHWVFKPDGEVEAEQVVYSKKQIPASNIGSVTFFAEK